MRIYRMKAELDKYVTFLYNIGDEYYNKEFDEMICNGSLISGKYDSIELEVELEKNEGRQIADCSHLWNITGAYIFSERAKNTLEQLLNKSVEFFPAYYQGKNLYIVNVLNKIDAMDYKNSVFKRLQTGSVLNIEKYSFIEEKVKGKNIFHIVIDGRIRTTNLFVSEKVKNMVAEYGLTGFKFEEVWDSQVQKK